MPKLFGTDGIRGQAGSFPLDEKTVYAVGRALGEFLERAEPDSRVLIGQDTRASSPAIVRALAAGLIASHSQPILAGVITTPGVAVLVRQRGFSAGVVVSASHNPYEDNGIKLISPLGMKLVDADEAEIECAIWKFLEHRPAGAVIGDVPAPDENLASEYLEFLRSAVPPDVRFPGLRIVLDCAHGAASRLAPGLFRSLGAEVIVMADQPDGRNINANCGSQHPQGLSAEVRETGAALGVAFDGDGDRAIFVTGAGQVVNGDGTLLAAARYLKAKALLRKDVVVGTVMANLGLEMALQREGIGLVRTPVGDRYVVEEMIRRGSNLGGEQAGHIVFFDDSVAGDGMLTAVKICTIVQESGRPLESWISDLEIFPQVLKNIRVREKKPLEEIPSVARAIAEAEKFFGSAGRVLVRYSGTEPLARVMIEGRRAEDVELYAERIADAIRQELGA